MSGVVTGKVSNICFYSVDDIISDPRLPNILYFASFPGQRLSGLGTLETDSL
jgi:hypothetical protein